MKIGFVGLGNMGRAMARCLLHAGHTLTVYNRTRARAEELGREGAQVADSPAGAAADAELLITMLADDTAVEAVVFGDEGILTTLPRTSIHAAMSTISPALSRRLADAHQNAGQCYVSAPIFGRPEAVKAGRSTVVAAGPADAVARCRPALEIFGQMVGPISKEAADANVIKLAGNFLFAAVVEALGEAVALICKQGLDPVQFLEIVNKQFQSPVYEGYGGRIVAERYTPPGFKLRHGLKDARYLLALADEAEAPMPLASLIHDANLAAVARGWGELDWAAFTRLARENAGLDHEKQ